MWMKLGSKSSGNDAEWKIKSCEVPGGIPHRWWDRLHIFRFNKLMNIVVVPSDSHGIRKFSSRISAFRVQNALFIPVVNIYK